MSPWPFPGSMHCARVLSTTASPSAGMELGCAVYRGSQGVLPSMQLALGSTAGTSLLQGSLQRGAHGCVVHGIRGPALRAPHAPMCQRGRGGQWEILPKPLHGSCCILPSLGGGSQAAGTALKGGVRVSSQYQMVTQNPAWSPGHTPDKENPCETVGVHGGVGAPCPCMHRGTQLSMHMWGCMCVFPQPGGICLNAKT